MNKMRNSTSVQLRSRYGTIDVSASRGGRREQQPICQLAEWSTQQDCLLSQFDHASYNAYDMNHYDPEYSQ